MPTELPDDWERTAVHAGYTKFVKRDAVEVPKRHAGGEPFQRDAVVAVTMDTAGVVKGPGARRTYQTDDPEGVGIALANAIETWLDNGGDPYGGEGLNRSLDDAAGDAPRRVAGEVL